MFLFLLSSFGLRPQAFHRPQAFRLRASTPQILAYKNMYRRADTREVDVQILAYKNMYMTARVRKKIPLREDLKNVREDVAREINKLREAVDQGQTPVDEIFMCFVTGKKLEDGQTLHSVFGEELDRIRCVNVTAVWNMNEDALPLHVRGLNERINLLDLRLQQVLDKLSLFGMVREAGPRQMSPSSIQYYPAYVDVLTPDHPPGLKPPLQSASRLGDLPASGR